MYYHNLSRSGVNQNLVFVELPYSQGPGLFTNLIIYHELGHFVFEMLESRRNKTPSLKRLVEVMEKSFDAKLGKVMKEAANRTWAKGVLRAWTEEIFCDLFALRFLGPAFTFALIDFLSLIGLMKEGSTDVVFDEEHPAPALRLRAQIERLRNDGWWETVNELASDHISFANDLASRHNYEFVVATERVPGFIEVFLEITPHIHELVKALTPDPQAAAKDFKNRRSEIETYFFEGVVPSHMLRQGTSKSPFPVSIINAAYTFYLTSMAGLLAKIDKSPGDLEKRGELAAKLEGWTLKALEDYQLYGHRPQG